MHSLLRQVTAVVVKVFGRLHDDLSTRADGRRSKSANGGNRERWATTVRRALGFDRDADAEGRSSDAVAVLEPAGAAHNPSLLAQILSKYGKVILGSLVTPMT